MPEYELDYETILRQQIWLLRGGHPLQPGDDYIVLGAQHMHSLAVMDALLDTSTRAVLLSQATTTANALNYLRFGAARRLQMIWYAYRRLIFTVPPDRTEPLREEEPSKLTNDLNTIYVNIRGVLDNLCWAILHQRVPERAAQINPMQVGLFMPCIVDAPEFANLSEQVKLHSEWNKDFANRRNPAAHKIPLAVPPQTLDKDELDAYRKLLAAHAQAAGAKNFDEANRIMEQLSGLGRFSPFFIHDPEIGVIPVYPTVPNDLVHMIELFRSVEQFFNKAV